MSWSFSYLKRLQNEIEKYKDKMMFVASSDHDLSSQYGLVKLSQELDRHILNYQNYCRILSSYHREPYSVDFYMNTEFILLELSEQGVLHYSQQNDRKIIIENHQGEIEGVIKESNYSKPLIMSNAEIDRQFSVCQTGSSIWLAYSLMNQNQSNSVIVIGFDGKPKGILDRDVIKRLCSQKTLNCTITDQLNKIEQTYNSIPVSIFVLDNKYYIEYVNTEAVKNFSEVLPGNYLFKKADLVFSSLFSSSYDEFISGEFWRNLVKQKTCSGIRIKLLNYINLVANIKIVNKNSHLQNIIICFMNLDELKDRVEEEKYNFDELSEALSLFLPYEIERELKMIPEYKDIFNYDTEKITIISKIKGGGYWHVINCLRLLSQLDRLGVFEIFHLDKDLLVQAIIVHDIGKIQPDLAVGDIINPKHIFESGKEHALRSARYCKARNYSKTVIALVKYHHHDEKELPRSWSKKLRLTFRLFKTVDGLSAAITRRNATVSFEIKGESIHIYENNKERPEYCKVHVLDLRT